MRILVLNSGSSSIKYRLFSMEDEAQLAEGHVDRIGEPEGLLVHRAEGAEPVRETRPVRDHGEGLRDILAALVANGALADTADLGAIGHRVVHGGEEFTTAVRVDEAVMRTISELVPLAPLHNPPNLHGIEEARRAFPATPQVAVFDTAFHQSIPPHAYHYALPRSAYTDHHVRRYGFHGTSHRYVARRAAQHLGRPLEALNLITLHLGNGASATAIAAGRSVDTSMGMTPLEGLVMGTRSGDVDPAVNFYLQRATGMSPAEMENVLIRESGLKGLCGANDMREVHRLAAAGDADARLALEVFCYRIRKYLGAYYAVLGRVDAVVFTGGIGENDHTVRSCSCGGLERLGIRLDPERNAAPCRDVLEVSAANSEVKVFAIRTNEELEIARQTLVCLGQS